MATLVDEWTGSGTCREQNFPREAESLGPSISSTESVAQGGEPSIPNGSSNAKSMIVSLQVSTTHSHEKLREGQKSGHPGVAMLPESMNK